MKSSQGGAEQLGGSNELSKLSQKRASQVPAKGGSRGTGVSIEICNPGNDSVHQEVTRGDLVKLLEVRFQILLNGEQADDSFRCSFEVPSRISSTGAEIVGESGFHGLLA